MSNEAYYGDGPAPTQQHGSNAYHGGQQTQAGTAHESYPQQQQQQQQQGYDQPGRSDEMPQQYQQQQQYSQQQGQGGPQHGEQQYAEQHGQGAGYNEPLQKKDTMTKILERLEQRFGGERFTNPDNAAKNRAMNENIIKKLTYAAKLIMQKAPGYAMRYGRQLF